MTWLRCLVMLALFTAAVSPVAGGSAANMVGVGYYVDYDATSRVTVQTEGQQLNWIVTTNYEIANTQGRLQGTHDQTILDQAHAVGANVHFRVINRGVSRSIAHSVLTRSSARRRLISDILGVLRTHNYDGVNIDIENIAPGDRTALTDFIRQLAAEVRALGKTLTMAVPPKTVDNPANDWNGAFDYTGLSAWLDWLVVMAYDEHGTWTEPGPTASMPWVRQVAQFASSAVAPNKLLLGVAFYGNDWALGGPDEAISMRTAVDRARANNAAILWDAVAEVPYYAYPGHVVYFENPQSVRSKLVLANDLGFSGIAVWRLGHETPDTWDVVTQFMQRNGLASAGGSPAR